MANKYYAYYPEAVGNEMPFGILVDENIMNIYSAIVKTNSTGANQAAASPDGYNTLEDLAVSLNVSEVAAKPSGMSLRGLKLQIPGFGSAFMPVLENRGVETEADNGAALNGDFSQTLSHHGLCVESPATPLQVDSEGNLSVLCTGYQGESRSI